MIRSPRSVRLLYDGQSRIAIPSWDGFLGYSWTRLTSAGRGRTVSMYNRGSSGQSWLNLSTTFDTRCRPYFTTVEPTVFVMCGGESDIIDDPLVTAEIAYERAKQYAARARACGAVYILGCAMIPGQLFKDTDGGSAETRRLEYNEIHMEDPDNVFDDVVNFDSGPLQDTVVGDYFFDGTHPYGPGEIEGYGKGLGVPYIADLARPHIDAAIEAVT